MKFGFNLLLWMVTALLCVTVSAAPITILEPDGIGSEKVAEGVEFSAYVIGNRWDMSDSTDVVTSESENLSNQSFSNGIFRATSVEDSSPDGYTDAMFFLTFQGVISSFLSLDNGQKYPVDTSLYSKLSLKIRHLNPNGTPTDSYHLVQAFFFQNERSFQDLTFGMTAGKSVISDGEWHIVEFDFIDDLHPSSQYNWTDFETVKGLRIDPTLNADTLIEVDWVRLTAPGDSTTHFNVQWSGGEGPYTVTAHKAGGPAIVLGSGISGTSLDADFSVLPGGHYSVDVFDGQETATGTHTVHVNETPLFNFLQPDIKGDVDRRFSLIETGNPWGPLDAGDVADTNQLAAISYANPAGSLTATSTGNDSSITLNTTKPIDTHKYRMLSYTMSVSGARDIGQGSVARILWGNDTSNLATSEDIIVQEGLNTYDLGDMLNLPLEGGVIGQWQTPPLYFRLDPHEFSVARNIRLDNVTLAPLDTAAPVFEVTWQDSDSDDDATIELFADLDKIPGNSNEVRIASGIAEDLSSDSFNWNAPDHVVDGEYFLYAQIDDGLNRTTRYATGPISVGEGAPVEITVVEPDGINDLVLAADEFSLDVLQNSWDMSESADVVLSRTAQITSQSISGGVYSGTSTGTDPSFHILHPGPVTGYAGLNGFDYPIYTNKFRYLTFKVRFSGEGQRLLNVYFTKDNSFASEVSGFTKLIPILAGEWNVITLDMEAETADNSPASWTELGLIKGLRIDPVNTAGASWEFDWFTLTGEPELGSQYQVKWTASDPGESTLDINAIDLNGVRIPLLSGLAPHNSAAIVDLTRLPVGVYSIEADARPGPVDVSSGPISIVTNLQDAENELFAIATRADVGTAIDGNLAIAGFIINGNAQKCVVIRGRGPSLPPLPGETRLPDPVLTLMSGQTMIAQNDNWTVQSNPGDADIISGLGHAPGDLLDAAIYKCLDPGPYTALLTGYLDTTGAGIVEVVDVDDGASYLFAISTRARVGTGELVTIAGFIIIGNAPRQVLIRGRGPSLDVPISVQRLGDPRLRLFDSNGANFETNDDWQDATNAASISATGAAPADNREAAILIALPPGAYTAILDGADGGTGAGIVEVIDLTDQ